MIVANPLGTNLKISAFAPDAGLANGITIGKLAVSTTAPLLGIYSVGRTGVSIIIPRRDQMIISSVPMVGTSKNLNSADLRLTTSSFALTSTATKLRGRKR